jgi:hypothetical protein
MQLPAVKKENRPLSQRPVSLLAIYKETIFLQPFLQAQKSDFEIEARTYAYKNM